MQTIKKIAAMCLALALCLTMSLAASAATVADATINTAAKGSLTVYSYDLTMSQVDGVWDNSYVSTGVADSNVTDTLADYAIQGTEYTYLKVADILQYTDITDSSANVMVLYGIDKTLGAELLAALGLSGGTGRFTNADGLDSTKYYYQSDVLIDALAAALEANATTVKNALEPYVKASGTAMAPTDEAGRTTAEELELGLYLVVTTAVEESTTVTCNPFFVSLPMTSVNGTNATDGGTRWIYDVTVYPKNLTGIPSLEKTLKESAADTGKTEDYAHNATASAGDVIDYRIVSTLPAITSSSTYLTRYGFVDTLSAGLTYCREDVVLTFYSDKACTEVVDTWTMEDDCFTVTYGTADNGGSVMTIDMTAAGLELINTSSAVYTEAGMVNSGYSDCTLVITYQAAVDTDSSLVCGDSGNPNEVVLTWQRTNSEYLDTLVDDCHLYSYAIDLTKTFSDNAGDFSKVEFLFRNSTDGCYVKASFNEAEGVYYVVDHVAAEADATHFIPTADGSILIKGLEDDAYTITETQTDNGYSLLKKDIQVVISTAATAAVCDVYKTDAIDLLQNDPRYTQEIIANAVTNGWITEDGGLENILNNMPQTHLEHTLLTASASVDGKSVVMLNDSGSANAIAPLSVVNNRGFDFVDTGDLGTFIISGVGAFSAVAVAALLLLGKKKKDQTA